MLRRRLRFRTRLTLAFVLVAGVSCGALALSTFVLSRDYRQRQFTVRARREAAIHVSMAPRPLTPDAATAMTALFDRVGGEDVLVTQPGGRMYASRKLTVSDVPARIRDTATAGASGSSVVDGRTYLVVAGQVDASRLYFFFDESELTGGLRRLGDVLVGGWIAILGVAALAGGLLARRTLAPVRAAGNAARAMAEGLLDTRLPVGLDDEFGRWARYFNEMASALEAKILALSEAHLREVRFTADVAHELRTPLAAAVSAAAVLESKLDEVPAELRRPVELVLSDVHRLRRLVMELLELSRLDAGRDAVATEMLSLTAVAEAVARAGPWDGAITVEGEPVWVWADRRRIERVVVNLLSNAVEHGVPPVTASVRADGASGVLEVHDAGPGIPADEQEAIFERFYKVDPSRSTPGIGLGLAIAMENVRSMNGTLRVDSAAGRGTTFRLRLPAAPTPEREEGSVDLDGDGGTGVAGSTRVADTARRPAS